MSNENRPCSYSKTESESNDICIHFVKSSNMNNGDDAYSIKHFVLRSISLDPDSFVEHLNLD